MATSDSQLITAADNMIVLNGEQVASDMILQYEGMLFKRQRGRSLRKGSGNRTRLKFQTRFCVLNNTGFTYKPKKSDKSKVCLANNNLNIIIESDLPHACACHGFYLRFTISHKDEGHLPNWKNKICQRRSSRCVQ